jgi:replicative superfamily II helicase
LRIVTLLFSAAQQHGLGCQPSAHAVIIRGTPNLRCDEGRWAGGVPLDILQMLGRADARNMTVKGEEGIILTQHSRLQFYLSLHRHAAGGKSDD